MMNDFGFARSMSKYGSTVAMPDACAVYSYVAVSRGRQRHHFAGDRAAPAPR